MNTTATANQTVTTNRGYDAAALAPWSVARRDDPAVTFGDVIDLLNAAGPLTVSNIAGALDVAPSAADATVRQMLARRCLRFDEWHRCSLAGACAE